MSPSGLELRRWDNWKLFRADEVFIGIASTARAVLPSESLLAVSSTFLIVSISPLPVDSARILVGSFVVGDFS